MNSQVVIRTEELRRTFGEIVAVDGISLEVHHGEVFGFLGHNGAGKTTTVRLLNGILGATAGKISVLGLDPLRDGPVLRRQTGVLTESPALDTMLTAREMLSLFARLYGVERRVVPGRVSELLEQFGLSERADDRVGGYSKGMTQRLVLARTLVHNPAILFLDEPTTGLDPVAARAVQTLITELSQHEGRTVFLCTHNLAEAQKLCDRVAVLEHGRIVAMGAPHDLARDLWKGVRLTVELDPANAQASLQNAALPEWEWHEHEHTATFRLRDREAIPALVTALAAAGGRVYQVETLEPTLEDVYFALHDHMEAAHD